MSSKITTFAIIFDRDNRTYYPGEIVSGRVITKLSAPKSIRGLKLVIVGQSSVRWSETRRRRDHDGRYRNVRITRHASEEYFSNRNYLFGDNSRPAFELPAGEHVHLFSYQLPYDLPSSFEHQYGHIRYTIKAIIDRPWKFDHETKTAFTVVALCDLNHKPEAALPVFGATSKIFGCLCFCRAGQFSAKIASPTSGFVPGQTIPVIIDYDNESSLQITDITVKLQKKLIFHAHGHTKRDDMLVAEIKNADLFSKNNHQLRIELRVPALPPSTLEHCRIIDLDYVVKVVISFTGCHSSIERKWPILIGTVPLISTIDTSQHYPPSAPSISTFEPQKQMPIPPQCQQRPLPPDMGFVIPRDDGSQSFNDRPMEKPEMAYNVQPPDLTQQAVVVPSPHGVCEDYNIPPPSYEECMYGTASIRDESESEYVQGTEVPFSPRYPFYNYGFVIQQDIRSTQPK